MKIQLKNKFINHFLKNGNKKTCETILLKSFKNIQKKNKKPYKKIIQLSIINSSPIFRIIVLKKKKQKITKNVPTFVTQKFERISWGLKYILKFRDSSFSSKFYRKLNQEILLNSQNKGNAIKIKTDFQKQAVEKKRFLLHFRW